MATLTTMPLSEVIANWRPGSYDPPWSWDDEEADVLKLPCLCATVDPQVEFIECPIPGHYQLMLEEHISEHGLAQPVCLGSDGRVWDGHHRIVAARRLGIETIPVED